MEETTKYPERGILLIATTHPYFGRMAANLAMTIKAVEDFPIVLIADTIALRDLDDSEKDLFFEIRTCPDIPSGLIGVNQVRMCLPQLSPFKETLVMDVDMLWLLKHTPSELFAVLADRDFTIINEGYMDLDSGEDHTTGRYMHWGNMEEIKEAHGLTGRFYQVRGEFLLFRKSPEVTKLYRTARRIQKNPKIDTKLLGGSVTDEFALNVAMSQLGIEPHESGWQPAYWPALHGNLMPTMSQLHDRYYAISFGGNYAHRLSLRAYGILAGAAANKLGLQYRFPLQSKRKYLTERIAN